MDGEKSQTTTTPLEDTSPDPERQQKTSDDDFAHDADGTLELLKKVEIDHPAHPIHWSISKKWAIISVYCLLQVFVSMTNVSYVYIEPDVQAEFGGSTQVLTLGQSMFIVGNAVGPVFLGPLSDIGGRKWVYVFSIMVFGIFNIGCAKALNLPMLIIFQFLSGAAGSTALSNVAGTVADLFGDRDEAGQPMALFVATSAIGPSIGSPVGELIYENLDWPWLFWINTILSAGFCLLLTLIPETLPRIVISRSSSSPTTTTPSPTLTKTLTSIRLITTLALYLLFTEPAILFLALYNGFAYGLLFLYLSALPLVFSGAYSLSPLNAACTYLNFVVGVALTFAFVPLQTALYRRDRRRRAARNPPQGPRPEARFLTSLLGVWGFPISLFWFAFTCEGPPAFPSPWSPIAAGALLAFANPLLYLSMLNYIADAYANVAASAVAAFLVPSFLGAAGFAHVGSVMFGALGAKWGFAVLGFVSLPLVGLIYVIFWGGEWMRRRGKGGVAKM